MLRLWMIGGVICVDWVSAALEIDMALIQVGLRYIDVQAVSIDDYGTLHSVYNDKRCSIMDSSSVADMPKSTPAASLWDQDKFTVLGKRRKLKNSFTYCSIHVESLAFIQ